MPAVGSLAPLVGLNPGRNTPRSPGLCGHRRAQPTEVIVDASADPKPDT